MAAGCFRKHWGGNLLFICYLLCKGTFSACHVLIEIKRRENTEKAMAADVHYGTIVT